MFINLEEDLSHIKDPEIKIKMRRIIDKIQMVLRNYSEEATDFLDPYERLLAKSLINKFSDLKYIEYGGLEDAERKIITIFPDYLDEISKLDIEVLRVKGPMLDLSHKDFLGALMSLGISRNKVGDILLHDTYTDIICKREIADFIFFNLEKVSNKNVDLIKAKIDDLDPIKLEYREIFKIISSLRLDTYISACYNLSRSSSMKIIRAGKVKVNWQITDKSSTELSEGDMISVKGFGRSILYATEGLTKKDNIKTIIRILM